MSRATNQQIAQGFAQGLQNFTQGYIKRKDEEAAKTVLEDPNSTPVQKALAWEKVSQGSGPKVYDSILKEQALKQKEANNSTIRTALNGGGQQAQQQEAQEPVQNFRSPVETANNMVSPQQQEAMGPEEMAYGPAAPGNEPISPAMQAINNARPPAPPEQPQPQGNTPRNPQDPYGHLSTPQLQQMLGATDDPSLTRQLQSIIHDRHEKEKNKTKLEAADVKTQGKIAEENRTEIREYSEPYKNIAGMEKSLNNLEKAEDLIMNSNEFSVDEAFIPTILQAWSEGKNQHQIAELLKTPAQQKMFSLMYDFIKPKELGGSNPSTKEVLLSMSKLVNPYKGKAANLFILQNMKDEAQIQLEKAKAIRQARGEGIDNYAQFQDRVDGILAEKTAQIRQESQNKFTVIEAKEFAKQNPPNPGNMWMLGPDKKARQVPANRVRELQAQGGVLLNG